MTPRTSSVRRRRKQYMSIVIPTPFWQRSKAPLLKASTTPFVKSRLLIMIWRHFMLILMSRPKPRFSASTPRARMSCLLMMPLLTALMVTEGLLLKVKSNSLWTASVILMTFKWRRRKKKTPTFSSKDFFFLM